MNEPKPKVQPTPITERLELERSNKGLDYISGLIESERLSDCLEYNGRTKTDFTYSLELKKTRLMLDVNTTCYSIPSGKYSVVGQISDEGFRVAMSNNESADRITVEKPIELDSMLISSTSIDSADVRELDHLDFAEMSIRLSHLRPWEAKLARKLARTEVVEEYENFYALWLETCENRGGAVHTVSVLEGNIGTSEHTVNAVIEYEKSELPDRSIVNVTITHESMATSDESLIYTLRLQYSSHHTHIKSADADRVLRLVSASATIEGLSNEQIKILDVSDPGVMAGFNATVAALLEKHSFDPSYPSAA